MINNIKFLFLVILFIVSATNINLIAQKSTSVEKKDKNELLKNVKTEADKKEINMTVKSIDITRFPETKLLIEAYNKLGEPLDTLSPNQITIFEKGIQFKAIKVEKVPVANNLPWDFVFVIDITGSMQPQIDGVVSNVLTFTKKLNERGIDYRLGLILFNDDIEKVYQPTNDASVFIAWLKGVKAYGGGDEKENALEALKAVTQRIQFREEANRIAILITDAPYHSKGENGDGSTQETLETMIDKLQKGDIRVFSITPPKFKNYSILSEQTRGTTYNIDYSFSSVIENFTKQITNLFYVTYKSEHTVIPDSIEIGLFDKEQSKIIKKTIPIVELGRRLIIENLLFATARYELPNNVNELNILADFMRSKENVSVLIEGHTDSLGSDQLNNRLSEQRAEAVKKYLVDKGINANRIQTKGFGKKRPIASNEDEFGRGLNRRTEIVIISKS